MERAIAGFPDAWGAHRVSLQPVAGPASYATFTAPTTGGQVVPVAPTGLRGLFYALGGVSDDGLYRAEVVGIEPADFQGIERPGMQIRLKWYVLATGAAVSNATDLSGSSVTLLLVAAS